MINLKKMPSEKKRQELMTEAIFCKEQREEV